MDPIQQLATRRIELDRALNEIKTQIQETNDELVDRVTHHAEGSHTVHAGNLNKCGRKFSLFLLNASPQNPDQLP